MALIDFTLSNARRFYSSMENPLGVKGLKKSMKLHQNFQRGVWGWGLTYKNDAGAHRKF